MPAKTKKVSASPAPVKKPVTKSVARKASAKKRVAKKLKPIVTVEEQMVPVVTVVEKEVQTQHGPVEVHHKYVFIGTCRNCEHMPMGANALVAVLLVAMTILSGMIISTSLPLDFHLPAISMGSLSDLLTPNTHVKNL